MVRVTPGLESCQVRSRTDRPCLRPAAVKIQRISFCEPCAREQEVYFAIGELTEVSRRPGNESLAEMLYPTRWIRRGKNLAARSTPGATVPASFPRSSRVRNDNSKGEDRRCGLKGYSAC